MMVNYNYYFDLFKAQNQNQADVNKTRTQGRWTLITAIASGLLGLIGTVLAIVLK